MLNIADVARATQLLTSKKVFDSICWEEMQDRSNPCCDWLHLPPTDRREYVETKRNVELIMPPESQRYQIIYDYMKKHFGKQWLSHDFFIKEIARALSFATYDEFKTAVRASQQYRAFLSQQRAKQGI